MPIYRQDDTGRFIPFEQSPADLERQLEDWIAENPHMLLEGEPLAIIGRQTSTAFGKTLDLLAVDETGATIVIELKKGLAPREVIAQAIEYSAWVDSQSREELDAVAHQYASKLTLDAENVAALYNRVFAQREDISVGEEPQEDASDQITFNARQRIVIVAEAFSGEMEQTLRYLRARLGVDISAVRFNVHRLELETLLETEILVGRESTGQVKAAGGSSKPTTNHDEIRAKVTTDFLRNQVDGLEEWLASVSPRMTVRHHKETNHSISLNGRTMGGYYFAVNWIHFWLKGRVEGDEGALARLSLPTSVLTKPDLVSGNVASESDLEIYKAQLMARVSSLNEVGKRLDE